MKKRILLDGLHLVEEAMEARYEILVAAIRSPQKEQPKIHENGLNRRSYQIGHLRHKTCHGIRFGYVSPEPNVLAI